MVGVVVGLAVGVCVGAADGDIVGPRLGETVGMVVGASVGAFVGASVGELVGLFVEATDGCTVLHVSHKPGHNCRSPIASTLVPTHSVCTCAVHDDTSGT